MDEADNKANGENMELLEGEAEFTKEKVEDENIINPPLLPVDGKFPLNLFLTPSLSNRLSCCATLDRSLRVGTLVLPSPPSPS